MSDVKEVRKIAMSFPEVTEEPHFEKTSFRVRKKIFASMAVDSNLLCVKLSEVDQDVFSIGNKKIIFPVANKWGKQGWTLIDLEKVGKSVLKDALKTAYIEVAPSKLSDLLK